MHQHGQTYVIHNMAVFSIEDIPKKIIKITIDGVEQTGCISDGYHTFDELYDHRITLYIALARVIHFNSSHLNFREVWRSVNHDDGSMLTGWFILGIGKAKGKQITYHLPMSRWDETDFAETLDKAPDWDGHTPADVLERLKHL